MGLTALELERRRSFVTASDAAPIMGVSPYTNIADVYFHKTEGIMPATSECLSTGTLLEPSVIEWARGQIGVIEDGDWHVHENGIIGATLDGQTPNREIVEAKTSGIVSPGFPSKWGDEWTDEIPDEYVMQVQTQMLVTGFEKAFVPALIGGRGFVMYVVKASPSLQDLIRKSMESFWNDFVIPRKLPPDAAPQLETLKRIKRITGKTVLIDGELVREFRTQREIAKQAEKAKVAAQANLIAALGDAEFGEFDEGIVKYPVIERKGYEVAPTSFRQLSLPK